MSDEKHTSEPMSDEEFLEFLNRPEVLVRYGDWKVVHADRFGEDGESIPPFSIPPGLKDEHFVSCGPCCSRFEVPYEEFARIARGETDGE